MKAYGIQQFASLLFQYVIRNALGKPTRKPGSGEYVKIAQGFRNLPYCAIFPPLYAEGGSMVATAQTWMMKTSGLCNIKERN